MAKKRQERLYPTESRKTLASFLKPHYRYRIGTMLDGLAPYLTERAGPPAAVTGLHIDWTRTGKGERMEIYEHLARMIWNEQGESTLQEPLIRLCRYLCHPDHGHFDMHENSLKARLQEAKHRLH